MCVTATRKLAMCQLAGRVCSRICGTETALLEVARLRDVESARAEQVEHRSRLAEARERLAGVSEELLDVQQEGFIAVTALSGEIVQVDRLGVATVGQLRHRLMELRPAPSGASYQLLCGTRLLRDDEALSVLEVLSDDIVLTAIAKELTREVVGHSKVLDLADEGRSVKMIQEPMGQDYGWVVYEAVPQEGSLTWQVTAKNFTGATLVGATTNCEDLDAIPGRQREGIHVEYRRSGNVRFYARGERPYYDTHSEIQSGEAVDLHIDTARGSITFTKNNQVVAQFDHSEETPIKGLEWYPCITLDEIGEEATVVFF